MSRAVKFYSLLTSAALILAGITAGGTPASATPSPDPATDDEAVTLSPGSDTPSEDEQTESDEPTSDEDTLIVDSPTEEPTTEPETTEPPSDEPTDSETEPLDTDTQQPQTLNRSAAPLATPSGIGSATVAWSARQIGQGWTAPIYRDAFAAGDLDGNGYDDMLLTKTDGSLMFYPTRSSTVFAPPVKVGHGWQSMYAIFGGSDFNGDGKVDILGIDLSGKLYMYAGLGNGRFASKQLVSSGWLGVEAISLGSKGFNGHPIITGIKDNTLYMWATDGKGRVLAPKSYGNGFGGTRLTAFTKDVSGDGIPDMWTITDSGDLRLYIASSGGRSLKYYRVGWGWNTAKYFLPTSNGRVVRAIFTKGQFPEGALRQYTLNTLRITTQGQAINARNATLPSPLDQTVSPEPPPAPELWPNLTTSGRSIGSG